MAGEHNTWTSSKQWHQDNSYSGMNDYNDNVIVPKSILIDTADAIRVKRDGTSAIETNGGEIISGNAITPEDFATEIGNLTTGGNSFTSTDFQTQVLKYQEATYSVKQTTMRWYGDYRKVAYMTLDGAKTTSNSTQHIIYIYVPICLTFKYTSNNKVLVPLININISGINGNAFMLHYGPNTSYNTDMSAGSNQAAILLSDLEASKNGSDATQYTATIYDNSGNAASTILPYSATRTVLYYPSATNKIVLE